jgi:GWxTD domain-containing protein
LGLGIDTLLISDFRNHSVRHLACLQTRGRCLRRLLALPILIILIYTSLGAGEQDIPAWNTSMASSGPLSFYGDIYQYEGNSQHTLVEISYAVELNQFLPVLDSSKNEITLIFQLTLRPSTPDSVITITERKRVEIGNDIQSTTYLDLKRFQLKPGIVDFELSISDSVSGLKGRQAKRLEIRSFPITFSLSDLAFISHVQKSSQNNAFEKNGLFMIPNPSRAYYTSSADPQIYIYYEINHMFYDPQKTSFYNIQCDISDLAGHEIWSQVKESLAKKSANSARIEKIPLADFKSGLFKFNLAVMDVSTGEICKSSAYFAVYSSALEAKFVLPMSENDIRRYFDQIRYIASPEEKNLFQQLDIYGKQQFLISFWKSRDPDPSTQQNEFMEQHFSLLAYCEKAFRGGIHSDMARIYITYGPPLEITRQPSYTGSNKASEVWTYAINGRTEFVFADRLGDGQYVLVHSTHPEEYQNGEWQKEMDGVINMNNR